MEVHDQPLPAKSVRRSTLFTVYFVAFLDLFAVSMLMPLLRKQSLDMGSSYTLAGLIGSVYGTTQFFFSPLVGDWSDRFGRTTVMSLTTFLAAIGYLMLALSEWLPIIFLARAISGCFKHTQTLCKAYLADLGHTGHTPARRKPSDVTGSSQKEIPIGESFGAFMTVSTSGFIIGPIVGGHLAEYKNGFQIVALSVVALFIVNAVILWNLPQRDTSASRHRKSASSVTSSPSTSFGIFKTVVNNYDIFLLQLLVSLSIMVVRTNYVQHINDNFGISIKWAGYLTSYQAALGVLGSACVSSRVVNRYYRDNKKLVTHTTILIGSSVMTIASTSSFAFYFIGLSVLNFTTPFSRLANLKQLLDRAENPEHHGALMGTSQSVGSLSRLSSSFLSGLAQDYVIGGPELIAGIACSFAVAQVLLTER